MKSLKTIAVLRKLSSDEASSILKDVEGKPDISLIFEHRNLVPDELGAIDHSIVHFDEEYKSLYDECFHPVIDFGHSLVDGKPVTEHLSIDKNSLWYYLRFMVINQHREVYFELKKIRKLLSEMETDEPLIVYGSCRYLKNNATIPKNVKLIFPVPVRHKIKYRAIFNFIISNIIRTFIGFFQLHRLFRNKKHVLLTDAQIDQLVINYDTLEQQKGNSITEYLEQRIAGESDFLIISENFPPKLELSDGFKLNRYLLLPNYKNTLYLETIIFLGMLNPLNYFRVIKKLNSLDKALETIRKYEGYTENQRMIMLTTISFRRLMRFILFRKQLLNVLFKIGKFETIGGIGEHNVRVKTILECAAEHNIKTFGIQHGIVHPFHMHYIYHQEDVKYKPFPDMTFLWGNHWKKELLQYSKYPENSLKPIGQLRTDIIPKLKGVKKSDIIEGLTEDNKVVFYASQPMFESDKSMRQKLARDFLKITKAFPGVDFIIKPHPSENDYESFFNPIASEIGTTNFRFTRGDLYKILAVSDVVVVYNSTVGGEACYFKKPLLVMNYGNNDFSGFIDANIGIGVQNFDEFREALTSVLAGNRSIDEASQQKFIHERAYEIDGNTCQRYIDEIRKLSKN